MAAKAARVTGRVESDPLAVWRSADTVYVAVLPRGPISVLEGSAVAIWTAANEGPLDSTADRVAEAVGLEVDDIRQSVDDFVGRLIAQGLITRSP